MMTGALVRIDPFIFTSLRYLIAGAAFLAVLIFKEGLSGLRESKGASAFMKQKGGLIIARAELGSNPLGPSQRLCQGADILDKQFSQGGERPVFQRDDSNRLW